MAPTPTKVVPDAAEETAVAAGVMSSALEAALGSAPEEEEAEHQEETEESPIASPPPPPLHGASACLHHHHSHHGRRPPRRGPDHYHRHAHPPDRPPRGVAEVFDRLVAGVIRPPRMIYEARALGPNPLLVPEQGLVAVRTDFEVTNARGQRLQCSVWKALDPNVSLPSNSTSDGGGGWPCVVYLHGNSSSRVEAVKTQVLKAALAGGAGGVAAFDFSGCGLSEGEFLSLGFFEAQDCAAVVDELRRRFGVGPAVLWGRSMGAVSALVYAATGGSLATRQQQRRGRRRGRARQAHGAGGVRPADPPPAGLILDSPFSSFRRLALDLTTKGLIRMPRLAVAAVLALLRRSVKRRAGFDLYHVNPLAHAHRAAGVGGIPIPALFLAAEQDELISPWHGEALEAAWPGPHKLGIRFPGTHNSTRPPIAYALASIFVRGAAVCAREYPALAATMALRLVERTAVVASQEEAAAAGAAAGVGAQGNGEEDEEGAGDGGGESESRRERRRQRREERRRRRERERRQQSPFQYGEAGAEEEGGEGKRKTKTQKPPPAPRFVRAGDGGRGSLASLPGATRALVAALDSSLAARAVEEYLLEELLYVGVALVAADLREGARAEQVQAQAGKEEAVAGTSQKVPRLAVAARAQRDLAVATAAPSSSAPPVLQAAAARLGGGNGNGSSNGSTSKGYVPPVGWEAVLKALEAGPEQSREAEATARALAGLRTAAAAAAAAAGHDYVEAGPYNSAAVTPMPMPAAPVAQATTPAVVSSRLRFCCFDPQDAHLSAAAAAASSPAAVKRRHLAVMAEAVFADA